MSKRDARFQYWHLAMNDEVGGFSITNYDVSYTSQLKRELGQMEVADVFSKELGQDIVQNHNQKLDDAVVEPFMDMYDKIQIRAEVQGRALQATELVSKGATADQYAHVLHVLAGTASNKIKDFLDD